MASGPTGKRRTQAERSETTRKRLLESAMKVIARRGYSSFTTAEAARLAGVTRGALAHHFPSKEAFVMAAVEHVFGAILERSKERAAKAAMSDDLLEAMVRDATEYFFGGEFLAAFDVLMSISKAGSKRVVRDIGTRFRVPAEKVWQDYLVARGFDAELAQDVVWIAFSVVRGLAIRTLLDHDPAQLQHTIDVVLEMLKVRIAGWDRRAIPSAADLQPTARKNRTKGVKHAG